MFVELPWVAWIQHRSILFVLVCPIRSKIKKREQKRRKARPVGQGVATRLPFGELELSTLVLSCFRTTPKSGAECVRGAPPPSRCKIIAIPSPLHPRRPSPPPPTPVAWEFRSPCAAEAVASGKARTPHRRSGAAREEQQRVGVPPRGSTSSTTRKTQPRLPWGWVARGTSWRRHRGGGTFASVFGGHSEAVILSRADFSRRPPGFGTGAGDTCLQ